MTEETSEPRPLELPANQSQSGLADMIPAAKESAASEAAVVVAEDDNSVGTVEPAGAEKAQAAKRFFPLDPRSIRADQFTGLIIFLVITAAALVGLAISYLSGPSWNWWIAAGGFLAGACLLFYFTICWPKLEFRYTRWTWDADGLEIHRGVFWQHRITVPISRIQHVDVSQGPLQRQFGLGKVTVHTAGTQHAAVELSGIAYEAAVWLREQIVAGQGGQDAV